MAFGVVLRTDDNLDLCVLPGGQRQRSRWSGCYIRRAVSTDAVPGTICAVSIRIHVRNHIVSARGQLEVENPVFVGRNLSDPFQQCCIVVHLDDAAL